MSDLAQRLTTALTDRYRIERELGRGGMATVFFAEDLRHHRRVAIKVLDPEVAAAIGPERFLREIETVARLTHPHILPLFDSGAADGLLFYVMPYIEGESLRSRLTRERQLPLADALRIAAELADALDYAHEHGLVHRDLKPENVLLQHGRALLADFGIARAVAASGAQRLTSTGVAVGTPTYMSPEQMAGGTVDARSDVYGLGCVVYEMLAGQPPFTGPTAESLAHQHLNVPAPEVTRLRPSAGAGVAAALMRALAKAPADRFATTGEFAAALGRVGEPATRVPAAATAPGSPAGPGPHRLPRPALAIAAIAVLALGVWFAWSPVSQWLSRRNAPAAPAKKQWILVAGFEGPRDEPDVACAVQGLAAAALDQSGIVMTVPRDQLKTALENAGEPDTLRVDGPLARELAYRNGIRSVLEGRVSKVGTSYSVVLRLSDSSNDSTLITLNGAARDGDALIRTVDQLGRDLRKELGENPAAVRATHDLTVIITPSFAAYRKVEQGFVGVCPSNAHGEKPTSTDAPGSTISNGPECFHGRNRPLSDYSDRLLGSPLRPATLAACRDRRCPCYPPLMDLHRASHITIRKAKLGPEADRLDREFWAGMTAAERIEETWRLTLELWELKGWDTGEPGLCRSVARVIRR